MNYPTFYLSDEDLLIIIVNSDYGKLLEPLRQNAKRYQKYNAHLGTKTKKSQLVQKNLPRILVSLFNKRDAEIVKVVEECAQELANQLVEYLSETLERNVESDEIKSFSDEEIADIISKYLKKEGNRLDPLLFRVQMKLNGCSDIDDRIDNILSLSDFEESDEDADTEDNDYSEDEEDNADDHQQLEKKVSHKAKHKKLTAQQKAAKNKAALAAKEKESQDKLVSEDIPLQEITEKYDVNKKNDDIGLEKNVTVENKKDKEKSDMTKYIGIINRIGNFYNFMPIGEYRDGEFDSFSETEIDEILPKSIKHNINFYYNPRDNSQVRYMQERFPENLPMMFEYDFSELEEHRTFEGVLNPTGYKYPAIDGYKNGTISSMSSSGLYRLIQMDELLDDIETKKVVRIDRDDFEFEEKVLVNLKNGFYAGPFKVIHSELSNSYHIKIQTDENKRFVLGYNSSDCTRVTIEPSRDFEAWIDYNQWNYYYIKDGAEVVSKDFISDAELLDSLKQAIEKTKDLDYSNLDIEGIVERLGSSQIVGDFLPKEIKQQRIERIKTIMSDEEELKQILSEAPNLIYELLVNNKESLQTESLISEMFEKRPDLLEKVQSIRAVQAKLDSARAELEDLKAQKEETAEQMRNMQSEEAMKAQSETVSVNLTVELEEKRNELDSILERLNIVKEALSIQEKVSKLKDEVSYYEKHKAHLQNDAKDLEKNFVELINGYSEKMADITFDGFMSSKMLQAAASWEQENDKSMLNSLVESMNGIEIQEKDVNSIVDYFVSVIQTVRPGYSKNDIINIMICIVQGFLTVFSGAPGCGKTSICNILAKTLGLNNYEKFSDNLKMVKRYIPVSVERGWTSKRDLIGYFNPLTKAFEESNKEVFDGLRFLDAEYGKKYNKWPFYILLDEANLSPMEYYWADFMNVCDDRDDNCSVNMGNNNVFKIPETLHFLATINNDHTTEILSPRLIDRAWVITLPNVSSIVTNVDIDENIIENISWINLKNAFYGELSEKKTFDRESKVIYEGLKEKLNKQGIYISPRVDKSILKYWIVGSELMEDDEYGNSPGLIALDYAISQKILPKILGSGDEYELWLNELRNYCDNKNLTHTVEILMSIITCGNRNMKCYQFFD